MCTVILLDALKETPPARLDFFETEELPEVWPSLSRPLWDEGLAPPPGLTFAPDNGEKNWEAFARLQSLPHLSLEVLRQNVEICLVDDDFVLLSSVLARFPVTQGVLEAMGYIILGSRLPHFCVPDQYDDLQLGEERWRLPRIMFRRELS